MPIALASTAPPPVGIASPGVLVAGLSADLIEVSETLQMTAIAYQNAALVDPSFITVEITGPGVTGTFVPVKSSLGVYYYNFLPTQAGDYAYCFSTGTPTLRASGSFHVIPTRPIDS